MGTRPKELPIIARNAGRLAGRAIGYVQLARGQFYTIMQHTQTRQVHKELQDTLSQIEAIHHEIRSISFVNPGPMTHRFVDNLDNSSRSDGIEPAKTPTEENGLHTANVGKDNAKANIRPWLHPQPVKNVLAEQSLQSGLDSTSGAVNLQEKVEHLLFYLCLLNALACYLIRKMMSEDLMWSWRTYWRQEVAQKAKDFFSQPQNLTKP